MKLRIKSDFQMLFEVIMLTDQMILPVDQTAHALSLRKPDYSLILQRHIDK